MTLDDASKLLGVVAILVYIVGYLVLSYYFARFGITLPSPFRARVLEAGIIAICFAAVPCAIGYSMAHIPHRGQPAAYIFALQCLVAPLACLGVVCTPGLIQGVPPFLTLHDEMSNPNLWRIPIKMVWLTFALGIPFGFAILIPYFIWLWRNYHKRRIATVVSLSLLNAILWLPRIRPLQYEPLSTRASVWFVTISIASIFLFQNGAKARNEEFGRDRKNKIENVLDRIVKAERKLDPAIAPLIAGDSPGAVDMSEAEAQTKLSDMRQTLWSLREEIDSQMSTGYLLHPALAFGSMNVLLWCCCFGIAVFTNEIYPYVPFRFGGGQSVPVIIDQGKIDHPGGSIRAALIDQNDSGVIVSAPANGGTMFLPKDDILCIHYLEVTRGR